VVKQLKTKQLNALSFSCRKAELNSICKSNLKTELLDKT